MPSVSPEQLEREADELHQQHFGKKGKKPPVATDSGNPPPDEAGDPPADDTPPVTTEEGNPPATDSDDPTKGLTAENFAERIKNTQARMTKATQEAASLRKEKDDLTRQIGTLQASLTQLQSEIEALKKNPPAPSNEPPPSQDSAALGDDPSLQELAKEYPSIVPPLLALISSQKSAIAELKAKVDTAAGKVEKSEAEKEAERKSAADKAHEYAILKVHPDAMTIADTDDFIGWVARQSPMIKRAVQEGTAVDVIDVLNRYKQSVGLDTAAREAEADNASDPAVPRVRNLKPSGKQQAKFTRAQIEAMSQEEFQRREPEIDAAIAAGLVR
jgi:hypothetical protein